MYGHVRPFLPRQEDLTRASPALADTHRSIPPYNDTESLAVLTAAADLGLNFWVTSSGYGPNEALLGRWFRANPSRRSEIFLATKFGRVIVDGKMLHPGTPEYVRTSCEKSLETLGVEYIDLYSQHRVDPETPIEETVRAMKALVDEGKVRYLGLSECSARTLRRASKIHHIAAVEMEFSPFALEIEDPGIGVLQAARECGTAVVAYAPLGKGFLTGAIKSRDDFPDGDARKTMFPRFSEENFAGNLRLVEELTKVAEEKGVKTSQLVIAWILAQGSGEFEFEFEFFSIMGQSFLNSVGKLIMCRFHSAAGNQTCQVFGGECGRC